MSGFQTTQLLQPLRCGISKTIKTLLEEVEASYFFIFVPQMKLKIDFFDIYIVTNNDLVIIVRYVESTGSLVQGHLFNSIPSLLVDSPQSNQGPHAMVRKERCKRVNGECLISSNNGFGF